MAAFCLFELFRRAGQMALVARDRSPELVDAPPVVAALRRLFGADAAT